MNSPLTPEFRFDIILDDMLNYLRMKFVLRWRTTALDKEIDGGL